MTDSPRKLQIETIVSAPFDQNAFIAWLEGGREAVLFDPGFDVETILETLDRYHLTLAAILNTHGHADHIAGNASMKKHAPAAPLVIGAGEAALLEDPNANLSAPFGLPLRSPAADILVRDKERIEFAGLSMLVREIPGHSPGSVVYILDQFEPPRVFGGDVLFAGSVGRVDFPGGSGPLLLSGIREKLFCLSNDTIILPGHGPRTTVGAERRSNPYVGELAGVITLD